ncbi:hypothetical protein NPIL_695451 [Nephila pilipes]|uniref:Uncharacterized protein n=1 Tax=Nephila pilipes TaxID=299642 RepID=A0A8X6PGD0_NEPPI|nr:hypothetical protein NPIL_695451 [Nephila pilipes]
MLSRSRLYVFYLRYLQLCSNAPTLKLGTTTTKIIGRNEEAVEFHQEKEGRVDTEEGGQTQNRKKGETTIICGRKRAWYFIVDQSLVPHKHFLSLPTEGSHFH